MFIRDFPVFFFGKAVQLDDKMRLVAQIKHFEPQTAEALLTLGVKSVSIHKMASAGGGSFAPQGGLFA